MNMTKFGMAMAARIPATKIDPQPRGMLAMASPRPPSSGCFSSRRSDTTPSTAPTIGTSGMQRSSESTKAVTASRLVFFFGVPPAMPALYQPGEHRATDDVV